jgi:hypothetical protein
LEPADGKKKSYPTVYAVFKEGVEWPRLLEEVPPFAHNYKDLGRKTDRVLQAMRDHMIMRHDIKLQEASELLHACPCF